MEQLWLEYSQDQNVQSQWKQGILFKLSEVYQEKIIRWTNSIVRKDHVFATSKI